MNEHRIHIPIDNKHPNCDSSNQNSLQSNKNEHPILSMAKEKSLSQQIIPNRLLTDIIPDNQDDSKKHIITYEFDNCRLNPEKELDDVTFSDDDEQMIEDYDNQSKKITEFYEEDNTLNRYTGTKNELEEAKELPEIYVLGENDILHNAGVVDEIVEDKIIIMVHIMMGILDLDNLLFSINGFCFGYIDDVIGKVEAPYYVVKFFPTADRSVINKDDVVFFVEKNAKIVRPDRIKRKGCDASNAFDEELPAEEMECSDDEEEQALRKKIKINKKRKTEQEEEPQEYVIKSINNLQNKYTQNIDHNNHNIYNNSNIMHNTNNMNPGYFNPYNTPEYAQINMFNTMQQQYMFNTMVQHNPHSHQQQQTNFNPFMQPINPFIHPTQNNNMNKN